MSNLFVGQLLLVPFNFPPRGWAQANGQLLPISQNTALFSLLGTYYGGDGKSNFALPDLRGRIPIGQGQGAGLSQYSIGEIAGQETVTLLSTEMPTHNHNLGAFPGQTNNTGSPSGNVFTHVGPNDNAAYGPAGALNQTLYSGMLGQVGNSLPHDNMMPYLTLNWIIAMQGVYPPRS